VQSLGLGKAVPGYFKILTFDKARWNAFADEFPAQPVAQGIKQNLESIQLSPVVFSREEIYASEFFKQKMDF
jgi:hypothetical protein